MRVALTSYAKKEVFALSFTPVKAALVSLS
jgi:hypothetical protein